MSETKLDTVYDPPIDGPARVAAVKALRPRDASTLIIVRRDAAMPRVLMGRRNAGHSFMPDKWVFPGGRIDRSDFRAPHATELRPDVAARLERAASPARARALALCAVRETFEETGLLLARAAPARPCAGPWRTFLAHGVLADLAALEVVARAITPTRRVKRFDARFFMADAERLISLERLPDCGELDELAWVELDEAAGLDLPNITRFILRELALRLDDPDRPAPFVRVLNGVQKLAHF